MSNVGSRAEKPKHGQEAKKISVSKGERKLQIEASQKTVLLREKGSSCQPPRQLPKAQDFVSSLLCICFGY